ncbi:hypothetical protein NSK_004667 [Nannochloropsis salina CCMP1776]|uniref:4-hydroxy-tetrahydrodipicolinate reductase n=1 Tax=Nannochloropsis salina CCMP1776 TaxID=1027361 RepID=A0A4D9CW84_9STRA|nr:hypothetical protein NSK_004667 [Nannochloropsis salina CCMP1776]|eukprot:TFJ83561.1 hypothetical protein NSK_004667 [Nannochloropsis salina CCMP1776]
MQVAVMVNGLPGAMGKEVAAACLRRGLEVCSVGLTGPQVDEESVDVDDGEGGQAQTIRLVKGPVTGAGDEECDARLQGLVAGYRDSGTRLIAVDYTHPTAVNPNGVLYARHKMDFVMGTTGGDREKLLKDVEEAGIYAVIAPNMAKQIVALQAGLETMAGTFPGAFEGYNLRVVESHQSSKADTSGTAKALIASFGTLVGKPYKVEDVIAMIRDREGQLEFGVPEAGLGGHAFHTYQLLSPDGSVEFQFRHNVVGRRIYAEGTVDALIYLAQQHGPDKKVFNMVDVLKAGAMK